MPFRHPTKQNRISTAMLAALFALFVFAEKSADSQNGQSNVRSADVRVLEELSVSQLEKRQEAIKDELAGLAEFSLRSGVGAIGYRSRTHYEPDHEEWFQIEFDGVHSVDQLVLVPTLLRDPDSGFKDDAFPVEFRIVAGIDKPMVSRGGEPIDLVDQTVQGGGQKQKPDGITIATFGKKDQLVPRIAPLIIECGGVDASWIRVEATVLSPRQFDSRYVLQFAEVMAFSGEVNIANDRPVRTSSNVPASSPAWDQSFAVDGFVPYLMNSSIGDKTLAFVSRVGIGDKPFLTIDLEKQCSLSEVRLHLVDQSDTVPQTYGGDFGIPGELLIEGAESPDFKDAKTLLVYRHKDFYDIGPIICRSIPETKCRYVRITAVSPYEFLYSNPDGSSVSGTRIGFTEIELMSGGENLALGKMVTAEFESSHPARSLELITDGNNRYGKILQTRDWMQQLALRHDLETELPRVTIELQRRYQQQKTVLNLVMGLAGLLALGTVITIYLGWNSRRQAVQRTRERIAADLHDELGANIHAIGLLSDMAQDSVEAPEKLASVLNRIRELTERTGKSTAYCANMLDSVGLFDDLEQDINRTANRITADLDKEIIIEGKEYLGQLGARKRIDLLLFYKESLTNIIRHSNATRVITELSANPNEVRLRIADNGQGIEENFADGVPPSLNRRARLLGATVKANSVSSGGTELELRLRIGQRWPWSIIKGSHYRSKQDSHS